MPNIAITLGGVLLPDSAVLKENPIPQESDNLTLDGSLYTDFVSVRRSWTISWVKLNKDEYDDIRQVFDDQYDLEAYPLLEIPYYNIEVPAKMSISEKDIHFDGECIIDFSITLDEQYAIS